MQKRKKQRSSNMELLRILSMLIIVMHHCVVHGKMTYTYDVFIPNRLFTDFFILGQLGVSLFMLITGYYQSKSEFKWQKLATMWLEVVFYSLGIYLITAAMNGGETFSWDNLYKAVTPVIQRRYWFVTAYFAVYILSPIWNAFAEKAERKQFFVILFSCAVLFSVLPTLTNRDIFLESGKSVMWMSVLYLTGAYLRKYPDAKIIKRSVCLPVGIVTAVLIIASEVLIDHFAMQDETLKKFVTYATNETSRFPLYILALSIFSFFVTVDIPYQRVINEIGASTFGVYLIHDNLYMRKILWIDLFGFNNHRFHPLLIPYMMCCAVLVFVCCIGIDRMRMKLFSFFRTQRAGLR